MSPWYEELRWWERLLRVRIRRLARVVVMDWGRPENPRRVFWRELP